MARHSPIKELEEMLPSFSRQRIYNLMSSYKCNSLEEFYKYLCEMDNLFNQLNKRIKKGK